MKSINLEKVKENPFSIDLQLFAEGAEGDDSTSTTNEESNTPEGDNDKQGASGEEGKTFTQEQLNEIVEQRIARERSKHAEQMDQKIKELKEELKINQLPEDERELAKLKQEQAKLAEERKLFEHQKKELSLINKCNELSVPNSIGKALAKAHSEEEALLKLEIIKKDIETQVQLEVLERLKRNGTGVRGANGGEQQKESLAEKLAMKRVENSKVKDNPYF